MKAKLFQLPQGIVGKFGELRHGQRGDVPGWVMITLMTAALVVLLWTIAGDALTNVFNSAIQRVLGGI